MNFRVEILVTEQNKIDIKAMDRKKLEIFVTKTQEWQATLHIYIKN